MDMAVNDSSGATRGERQGFTLIELLVVIAIIALIAAILFPVFASAREKARQTTCLSNEKQMALALNQYVQDYDERLIQGGFSGALGTYRWFEILDPYIGQHTAGIDNSAGTNN